MKRSRSCPARLFAIPFILFVAGCGATGEGSIHPRVAFLEPRGEASWTQAPSLEPATPGTQCPTGLVNDESRRCVPHDLATPHDIARSDFPDRIARIGGASFDLDITETTVDAYARCVAAGVCTEPARMREIQSIEIIKIESRCNSGVLDKGTHPRELRELPSGKDVLRVGWQATSDGRRVGHGGYRR